MFTYFVQFLHHSRLLSVWTSKTETFLLYQHCWNCKIGSCKFSSAWAHFRFVSFIWMRIVVSEIQVLKLFAAGTVAGSSFQIEVQKLKRIEKFGKRNMPTWKIDELFWDEVIFSFLFDQAGSFIHFFRRLEKITFQLLVFFIGWKVAITILDELNYCWKKMFQCLQLFVR